MTPPVLCILQAAGPPVRIIIRFRFGYYSLIWFTTSNVTTLQYLLPFLPSSLLIVVLGVAPRQPLRHRSLHNHAHGRGRGPDISFKIEIAETESLYAPLQLALDPTTHVHARMIRLCKHHARWSQASLCVCLRGHALEISKPQIALPFTKLDHEPRDFAHDTGFRNEILKSVIVFSLFNRRKRTPVDIGIEIFVSFLVAYHTLPLPCPRRSGSYPDILGRRRRSMASISR